MRELIVLAVVVVAVMAATALVAGLVGRLLRRLELVLTAAAAAIACFVMLLIGAEVVMRYGFNSPIPGQLEGSELLMPIIVFFGLSYTQATHGHVGMDLVLDSLPARPKRHATMATMMISMAVCSVLGWFSAKNAYQLWLYDDVTMTPPYFRTWPSAAAVAVGYLLTALRIDLQLLHLWNPDRFPANEPESGGFHAVE